MARNQSMEQRTIMTLGRLILIVTLAFCAGVFLTAGLLDFYEEEHRPVTIYLSPGIAEDDIFTPNESDIDIQRLPEGQNEDLF